MKKVLLDACCAPCAVGVIDRLEKSGYWVVVFFSNSNVQPRQEYEKRKKEIKNYCLKQKIDFIEDEYQPQDWLKTVKGLENEPEGGSRCFKCYEYRLRRLVAWAKQNDFSEFASTLTISPHKKAVLINEIGQQLAMQNKLKFLAVDWKKEDGFKHACQLAREHNFYRQNYCGCLFSLRN